MDNTLNKQIDIIGNILLRPINTAYGRLKPIIKWAGGKSSELPLIRNHIPNNFNRYFEPFLGGGAVYFDIISNKNYLNDICEDLINFYSFIKQNEYRFFKELEIIYHKQETTSLQEIYYKVRDNYNKVIYGQTKCNIYKKCAWFFFLREYSYGGMFRYNSRGGFNVPCGNAYRGKMFRKKVNSLLSENLQHKLKSSTFNCMDFEDFLDKYSPTKEDFIFIDPPYDCQFTTYDNNVFELKEQERLANYLKRCQAKFMIVCKKNRHYRQIIL